MSALVKARLDPHRAYGALWEEERGVDGTLVPTAVVLLTNRQCPFRCVMCDLWVNTLDDRVPAGAIPEQIAAAIGSLPSARQIKLYNAGSFFDPDAIPPGDDGRIAEVLAPFERVIVEAHPAFLRGVHGERCLRFRDALRGELEVAVGLETVHAQVLARLNKGMTVEAFLEAARFLSRDAIALRAFVLLKPPFMTEDEGIEWACRSLDAAAAAGATASTVIPTRRGNPPMERGGVPFVQPRLSSLERVLEYGLARRRGRVFADTWEIERFHTCGCSPARAGRLRRMNREQQVPEPITCACETPPADAEALPL